MDWAKIEAEYVNSTIGLKALAAKYGVTASALQKRSAAGKWSEKRRKFAEKKAEKISERLHEKDVKQTVRDIERVCKAAGKLIDAANRAINQLDKAAYVSFDDIEQTAEQTEADGMTTTHTVKKRKLRMKQEKTIVNTKRMAEIAKTLCNIKEVLTGDNGRADDTENSGVIEITAATQIDDRPQEDTDG